MTTKKDNCKVVYWNANIFAFVLGWAMNDDRSTYTWNLSNDARQGIDLDIYTMAVG